MNAECGVRSAECRARWITIGVVRVGWYVFRRQWGCPNGLLMHWRGRRHVFQCFEFLRWEELVRAICLRLRRARLRVISLACGLPAARERQPANHVELRALVVRGRLPEFVEPFYE